MQPKRVLGIFGGLVVLALLVPTIIMALPGLVGAEDAEVVLTGSMMPGINPGDLVVLRDFDPTRDTLQVGDIVAFKYVLSSPQPAVLHRIIEIEQGDDGKTYYITKGDNNDTPDGRPITASNVLSFYAFRIPWYGHLVLLSKSKWGIMAFVVVPALLVLGRELVRLSRMDDDDKAGANGTSGKGRSGGKGARVGSRRQAVRGPTSLAAASRPAHSAPPTPRRPSATPPRPPAANVPRARTVHHFPAPQGRPAGTPASPASGSTRPVGTPARRTTTKPVRAGSLPRAVVLPRGPPNATRRSIGGGA